MTKSAVAEKLSYEGYGHQNKEDLILQYAPFIKYIANRITARLPSHIEIHDMINSGVLGLIDALEKFDPAKGVKFETYAEYRVKGAMLDNLRSMDWVPRSVRKVATMLENVYSDLEKKLGREATDEEVADAMNIEVDKFHKMVNRAGTIPMLSLERDPKNGDSRHSFLDKLMNVDEKTPFERLDNEELQDILLDNIVDLPDREKLVVSLYYYKELTMKEIGRILNLTESRVSQIHSKAVKRLRGRISKCYC